MKFLLVLFVFFEVYYCQLFIAKNVPKWSVKVSLKWTNLNWIKERLFIINILFRTQQK